MIVQLIVLHFFGLYSLSSFYHFPKDFYRKQYPIQFCGECCFWRLLKFVVPHSQSSATCLMWVTYASFVSVFSSKLKDLHTWNNCSLVLPILEYCCLNKFCNPCQSTFIDCSDWYHNLVSPNSVRQNLWTLTLSMKWCSFIQSLVWSRCPSAFSSGFLKILGWNKTNLYVLIAVLVVVDPVELALGLEGDKVLEHLVPDLPFRSHV